VQCQATLEPWDESAAGLAFVVGTRCPRRVVSTIEYKWVCRQHLSAALYRLRGLPDPPALWWELQQVEAAGRCPLCGDDLRQLDAARLTSAGTLTDYAACPKPTCHGQLETAWQNAQRATIPD